VARRAAAVERVWTHWRPARRASGLLSGAGQSIQASAATSRDVRDVLDTRGVPVSRRSRSWSWLPSYPPEATSVFQACPSHHMRWVMLVCDRARPATSWAEEHTAAARRQDQILVRVDDVDVRASAIRATPPQGCGRRMSSWSRKATKSRWPWRAPSWRLRRCSVLGSIGDLIRESRPPPHRGSPAMWAFEASSATQSSSPHMLVTQDRIASRSHAASGRGREHHAEKRRTAHPRGGAHLQERSAMARWRRATPGSRRHVSAARTRPAAHDAPGCATHRPDGVSHPVEDERVALRRRVPIAGGAGRWHRA